MDTTAAPVDTWSGVTAAGAGWAARRAVGGRICRKAGDAVACWYRMVLDNVRDNRYVWFYLS
jgi:hypothetical protein